MRWLLLSIFLGFSTTAVAVEEFCNFKTPPRVFLVGEVHGTEAAGQMRDLMMRAALKDKKIYHGLEIDPIALKQVLQPQFHNAMYGMEEPFSKGFATIYWSWSLSKKHWLMKTLTRDPLYEAVRSFHYFLLTNSYMQEAWQSAKGDVTVSAAKLPEVGEFVRAIDKSLANQLPPDQAELPIPLDSEDKLAATEIVLKAVLRAYVEKALTETPDREPKYIPATFSKMNDLLNYPEFTKGDRNYDIHLKTFMYISQRLKQLFVLDWRSEQMSRAILRQLCLQADLPTVAIVGGDHLARMEEFLKQRGVNASLDMQGASKTGEFEQLLKSLAGGNSGT